MSKIAKDFTKYVKLTAFTKRLLETPEKTIKAERDPASEAGYSYPMADRFFGTETPEALSEMAEIGLLERKLQSRELGCPVDVSLNVTLRQYCPKCDSSEFTNEEIIEHLVDGYIGPKSDFVNNVCPKDNKPLKQLGVDYVKHGRKYVCAKCREIFQEPVLKMICINDGTIFKPEEAKYIDLYSYTGTNKLEEETNKILYQQKYISDKLKGLGFNVASPGYLTGKSGIQHDFFIVASSGIGLLKTKVVIEVLTAKEVDENEVFATYTKAADVKANGILIAAIPKFSSQAKKVAETYDIATTESHDFPSASEQIVEKFKELMTSPAEEALSLGE